MLYCDRTLRDTYLSVAGGCVRCCGNHIFWLGPSGGLYSPLPFFGMATEIIAVFSKKPSLVTEHGLRHALHWCFVLRRCGRTTCHDRCGCCSFFSFMSLMIAVPTGIKIYWIGTMWRGELGSPRHVDGALLPVYVPHRRLTGHLPGQSPAGLLHPRHYFVVAHFH